MACAPGGDLVTDDRRRRRAMFETWSQETLWVNLMNVVLGLVCLVAVAAVAVVLGRDLFDKVKNRGKAKQAEAPVLYLLRSVGPTMADGGEPVDEGQKARG
jgi:hypothetical protein